MKYKRFLGTALLAVLVSPLTGCGSTTSAVSSLGKPAAPGNQGATSPLRLDFLVDNNQVQKPLDANGKPANTLVNLVKSYILVQAQNSTNPNFDFQFTDFKPDANGAPTYNALSYAILPNTPFVYYDTRVSYPADKAGDIAAHLGTFDRATYSYTPPPKILTNIYLPGQQGKPLDTFAINAIPQDPVLKSSALLIHLNLSVTVSPPASPPPATTPGQPTSGLPAWPPGSLTVTIPANTDNGIGTGGQTQNKQTFTASVPGDGILNPYDPKTPGTGQVDWTCSLLDKAGKVVKDASSLIDKTSGVFTAPLTQDVLSAYEFRDNPPAGSTQNVYQIKAASRTQPDKSATSLIIVARQGTTIHLQ